MNEVNIQSISIDQISVLIISPTEVKNAPLVFFVHGVASDKRQGISLGFEIARKGIVFVSLDSVRRGERKEQKFDPKVGGDFGSIYPEASGLDGFFTMVRMICQTDMDLHTLIEYFQDDPRIDPERIGMAGYSMGGWATFYNMAANPRIKAAAAIAGTPCFEERWNDVVLESSTYPEWSENIKNNLTETNLRANFIRKMDPISYLLEETINPLLMICGDLDHGPKLSCLDLYGKINQKYQQKTDYLKLSIHDGIDHQLTLPMAEETAAWFEGIL